MKYRVVPIAEEHIRGFRAVLDRVSREKKYLALFKAPPLKEARKFVRANIRNGNPQFVLLADGEVVEHLLSMRLLKQGLER